MVLRRPFTTSWGYRISLIFLGLFGITLRKRRAQWRVIRGRSSSGGPPGISAQLLRMNTLSAVDFTPTRIFPILRKDSQVLASTVVNHVSVAQVATRQSPSGSPPLSRVPCRTRKRLPSAISTTTSSADSNATRASCACTWLGFLVS
ncbi:hypothetical protein D3C86_1756680 [compost metagenome]